MAEPVATFPTCPACGGGVWPSGHTCPCGESPQDVTYQEAILDGADPMEGFYE